MSNKKGKKVIVVVASAVLAASIFPQGGRVLGDTESIISGHSQDTTPPEIELMEGVGNYLGKIVGKVKDESSVKLYLYEGNSATGTPTELTVTWFGFFTIDKQAEPKTYTLIAIDAAGNKTERHFSVGAYDQSDKKDGTASIKVDHLYYGETPVVYLESETNGTDHVSVYWKEEDADDSSYQMQKPTEVGVYTVKAVFAATNEYKEVIVYETVSITRMKVTEELYAISGQKGENGWYRSDVEIIPKKGYLISEEWQEGFKGSLTLKETRKDLKITLKNPDSGAITEEKSLPVIKIDKNEPKISGVIDGQAYEQTEALSVTIEDENLDQIFLNGQEISLTDEKTAVVNIDPKTEKETYKLEARDKAGNKASCSFSLVKSHNAAPVESNEPSPTDLPKETKKPQATELIKPTNDPRQTDEPKDTNKPNKTETPKQTGIPEETNKPQTTDSITATKTPTETKKPNVAEGSLPTNQPNKTQKPSAPAQPITRPADSNLLLPQPSDETWLAPHPAGQSAAVGNAQAWQLEDALIKESGRKYVRAGMMYRFGQGTWHVKGDQTVYVGGSYFCVEESGNYEFIQD